MCVLDAGFKLAQDRPTGCKALAEMMSPPHLLAQARIATYHGAQMIRIE
jgi:hypothetical protein